MDCPSCNRPIKPSDGTDGSLSFSCGHCGWGQDRVAQAGDDTPAELEPVNWGRLGLYWFGALIIVIGPFIGLHVALSMGLTQMPALEEHIAMDRVYALLNVHYWWVMAVYVFLAALITPSVDRDNLGIGGTWIDNPFSYEDDFNRAMMTLAIVLLPGKVVWIALRNTFYVLTARR